MRPVLLLLVALSLSICDPTPKPDCGKCSAACPNGACPPGMACSINGCEPHEHRAPMARR